MDEKMTVQTLSSYCVRCRISGNKFANSKQNEKLCICLFIMLIMVVISLMCFIFYFVIVVQNLSSSHAEVLQRLNHMHAELQKLKQKYKQVERQWKATNPTMQSDRFEKDGIELVVVDPLEGSEVVPMDIKRSKRDLHAVEVPLTRQKRAKRRKRCKDCLPAIQIEGSGGIQKGLPFKATDGIWTPASWHREYALTKSAFQYSRVGKNGQVSVRKSGIYLLYGQVTLTGKTKRGYQILLKKTDGNESTLAVCKRHMIQDGISESDSCCTLKVVVLKRGDAIFIREENDNTGANYSKSHTYFGLIRLGTV